MRIPDADENLRRARIMIASASAKARSARIEIYHRASARRRVSVTAERSAPEIQEVMEEGIAVRVLSDGRAGFAAIGGGEAQLAWALERAVASARPASARRTLWAAGAGSTLFDRQEPTPPSVEEMLARLPEGDGSWVEAGVTVESLVSSEGVLASRTRARVWAMTLRRSVPDGREQPRTSYGRALTDLDDLDEAPPISEGGELAVFAGEASRSLVLALAGELHGEGATPEIPVGKGWSLRDDPLHPRSITGGTFDDAGFPTRSVLLADGHTTLARIEGPGHLQRPSYRDLPEAHPACLTVLAENATFPNRATHIGDVRILATDPTSWVLECDGQRLRRVLVRTTPIDLVRGIVGTAGPARSYGTVVTPALVVEGLRFET